MPKLSEPVRIAAFTLALCAIPYVGLRAYLVFGMHEGTAAGTVPSPSTTSALFAFGVLSPLVGVSWTLRWVLQGGLHLRLSGLLEAYAALILLFSSGYAIVQASTLGTSFAGMPELWSVGEAVGLDAHVGRLHALFFEALYLSVMTITTVGFGDLVPLTRFGKVLTALEGLAGIGFVGVALGHYFSVCLRRRGP